MKKKAKKTVRFGEKPAEVLTFDGILDEMGEWTAHHAQIKSGVIKGWIADLNRVIMAKTIEECLIRTALDNLRKANAKVRPLLHFVKANEECHPDDLDAIGEWLDVVGLDDDLLKEGVA